MYSREQYWASVEKEIDIIKHLASKITVDQLDYRPTPKQRNLLELLQYLRILGTGILGVYFEGDASLFSKLTPIANEINLDNFEAGMDVAKIEMKEEFAKFTDEELTKELDLWGVKQTKADFLMDFLKMYAAYKMQLFLYAKAAGHDTIGTSNVWRGMDMPVTV